jgi:hypothetical protein
VKNVFGNDYNKRVNSCRLVELEASLILAAPVYSFCVTLE